MYNIFLLIITVIVVGFGFYLFNNKVNTKQSSVISEKEAKNLLRDVVENDQTKIEINGIEKEGVFYKVDATINKQKVSFLITEDGKQIAQSDNVLSIEKIKEDKKKAEENQKPVKSDKPKVELFVMSYCPYGTMMEKGILPVLDKLGDKIDYNLDFVNYAMHGKKEVEENTREYCIGKEYKDKQNSYLKCFLDDKDKALVGKDGDRKEISKKCMKENNIDVSKIDSCVKKADNEFKITKNLNNKKGTYPKYDINNDLNEKYEVAGSPTLVINGKKVEVSRDPNSILKAICARFNNPPEECKGDISSKTPAPGFGYNESQNTQASNASCGS